ncbi:hypothetical protein I6H48_06370 [Corynebacterium amycolatum]|uniref:GNAT family N-acetyltransferase n=1 Tax=Corynebacterium amycolatum TaxID=43765 RepID=A0AB37GEF1_CORAY|nr:hypothetical protein [Corynebacterium amycolatum]QPR31922.1 hypothetical protein I6G95_05800 [Corynebacterium amycolatum]QQB81637.1 hypothetical protein I6H48_06370 [Corynebacterium amycolatum]
MTTTYTTKWDETFTITTRTGKYDDTNPNDTISRVIEAHDEDGELASALYADLETGQIMQVETREENRGEGIATALVQYACDTGIDLYHSPEEHRTEKGNDFARRCDFIDEIDPDLAYQPA